jgi:hypothetical protein
MRALAEREENCRLGGPKRMREGEEEEEEGRYCS